MGNHGINADRGEEHCETGERPKKPRETPIPSHGLRNALLQWISIVNRLAAVLSCNTGANRLGQVPRIPPGPEQNVPAAEIGR